MAIKPQVLLEDFSITNDISALDETVILELSGVSGGKAVVSGTWVGTIKFEGTVDGSRWDAVGSFSGTTGTPVSQTGITSNDVVVFVGIAGLAQIRARFHAYTSGSATVTLRGSNGVSNVFVDNLVPANLKTQIFGYDGTTPRAVLTQPTGELIILRKNNYSHVTGAGTTVIKSEAGRLNKVVINKPTNGTATIYDNTSGSGTIIAVISYTNGTAPTYLEYDLDFTTGLTIVTTGGGTDITITYL